MPNTRNTCATYFCKSGFIRKARVVRRDVELPELPILYKKTFKRHTHTRTHIYTYTEKHAQGIHYLTHVCIYIYIYIYTLTQIYNILVHTHTLWRRSVTRETIS